MKNPFVNFLLGFVAVILSLILIMVAVTDALSIPELIFLKPTM